MSERAAIPKRDKRPEFMATLGISPPYTAEDVRQAYFLRAKQLHPDHGGSAAAFQELHQAFEKAEQYVEFRGDRRGWIAAKVGAYMAVQDAIRRIEALGGEAVSRTTDWLTKSIGDFAQLTETVDAVRLVDSERGDEMVRTLAELRPALKGLTDVELPGCRVSDQSIQLLKLYQELRRLDLSRTPVTAACLTIVDEIPSLDSINVDGSRIGWLARRRVQSKLRRRAAAGI